MTLAKIQVGVWRFKLDTLLASSCGRCNAANNLCYWVSQEVQWKEIGNLSSETKVLA